MHFLPYVVFITTRLALATVTIFAVATLVFFGMRLLPGNYADIFFVLADDASKAALTEAYGLNKSAFTQYVLWIGRMLEGDFGTSLATGKPVVFEIASRLPLTLELGIIALIFVLFLGMPLGIVSGAFHRSAGSQVGRYSSTILMSIPNFVLGSLFVYLFSINDLWLRAGSWMTIEAGGVLGNFQHVLLPAFTLSVTGLGMVLATTRSSVMGVMGQDHILAAVSRGLTPGVIFSRHIFRNALIPIITIFAIIAGYLLGGTVLVETVFTLDGVGRLIVNSVTTRDYPVVQTGVIFTAAAFVLTNTIADILYGLIDPRVTVKRDG